MLRRFAIPAALAGLLVLASCGDVTGAGSATSTPGSATAPTILPDVSLVPPTTVPQSTVPHPAVSVPATIPTTLVSTVLKPGTGTPSTTGDAVVVNYVGARTADGKEFDNNYGTTPLTVTPLGAAQVIDGFNQGLVGVQQGEQLQLDVPNDLAYGDQDKGDVIKAGDALSFVIDVLGVLPATTAANTPDV
ncbi:MAG: FKBP-type peptidyl-prolyl cis-trans isomerase, partial [Ilumatobacteraceae bacterium]